MHIVISDDYQDAVRRLACFWKLRDHTVTIHRDTLKDRDGLAERFRDAEAIVLIRERTEIRGELLDRLPKLRLISQTGKISNHLRVPECTARGIAIAEGVGAPTSTAELTWALVMAATRHLPQEIANLKAGGWQQRIGRQLHGRRLGIWSYGKIGRIIAGYGRAFGMKIWVWGRSGSIAAAAADGYEVAPSRQAFFAESDVVSLHLRLNAETRGMVTAADLSAMKPDALFVNTSRAELLQPGVLVRALRGGNPGFAAVDVYEEEPVTAANHPLLSLPNAICSPHLGYVEQDNYELYFGAAFDNVNAFAAVAPTNLANPGVL